MAHLVDPDFAAAVSEFEALADVVTDVESMQEQLCEVIGDESSEFGKALVDHFPVEDGMPYFSDVQDFTRNWVEDESNDDCVDIADRVCQVMELVYAIRRW